MSNSVPAFWCLCVLLPTAAAQQANSSRTVVSAPAELVAAQALATATLLSPPAGAAARAGAVLAALRNGDIENAAARLGMDRAALRDSSTSTTDTAQVAWLVGAHLWTLRATGDRQHIVPRLPALLAASEAAAAEPRSLRFAEEALQVHMLLCSGNLLDHCERNRPSPAVRPGARWSERAVERLLELERRSWQPGVGHYRPQLTRGDIALPAAADASLLLPAAAGMLVGSGERVLQNLRTVLAAPGIDPADPHYLAAATLCRDDAARARSYAALLASDALQDPERAGFAFDALCYAVTGLRLAVGAAVDEDWVRFSPWLPPGRERVELHGLRSHGARFDLCLTALDASVARLQLRLAAAVDGAERTFVVHAGEVQHLQVLQVGATCTIELARPQPEAQHQPLPHGHSGH